MVVTIMDPSMEPFNVKVGIIYGHVRMNVKNCAVTYPLNPGVLVPVVPVGAAVAHREPAQVPHAVGSHHWGQGPGDAGAVLPSEGALGLAPGYVHHVPVLVVAPTVKVVVNVVEALDTVDVGLNFGFGIASGAGRRTSGRARGGA